MVEEEEEPGEVVGVERSERDVERGSGGRRWLGVVVGAVGMSFVRVWFADCFEYVECQACLVPTELGQYSLSLSLSCFRDVVLY